MSTRLGPPSVDTVVFCLSHILSQLAALFPYINGTCMWFTWKNPNVQTKSRAYGWFYLRAPLFRCCTRCIVMSTLYCMRCPCVLFIRSACMRCPWALQIRAFIFAPVDACADREWGPLFSKYGNSHSEYTLDIKHDFIKPIHYFNICCTFVHFLYISVLVLRILMWPMWPLCIDA